MGMDGTFSYVWFSLSTFRALPRGNNINEWGREKRLHVCRKTLKLEKTSINLTGFNYAHETAGLCVTQGQVTRKLFWSPISWIYISSMLTVNSSLICLLILFVSQSYGHIEFDFQIGQHKGVFMPLIFIHPVIAVLK